MNNLNSKKVLLVSPFFFPEVISTGKYNTSLVNALLNHVESIDVISSYPIYPDWQPSFTDQTIPNVSIHRGGLFLRYPHSAILRRIVLESWFTVFTMLTVLKLKIKSDIVIVVFPPSLFFLILCRLIPPSTKVVGIVHDLQGVYSQRSKNFISKIITNLITLVEKKGFQSCDQLIFLSRSMCSQAKTAYRLDESKTKISIQYPFVNLKPSKKTSGQNPMSDGLDQMLNLRNQGKKNLVYSGALGAKQNPFELILLFQKIVSEVDDIYCHIFSRGPVFDRLSKDLDAQYRDKIFFNDLVHEDHLETLYDLSDFHVLPQAQGTSEGSLPSKLPNLLSCGVPIFLICDEGSELSQIMQESGIGYATHGWRIPHLVEEFKKFMSLFVEKNRQDLKSSAKVFVEKNFSIASLVETILLD